MKNWIKSKESRKITFIIIILCIAIIIQIIGVLYFNEKLYNISLERSIKQIEELSVYVEKNFQLEVEHYISMLKTTEIQLEKEDNIFSPNILKKVKEMRENSNFKIAGISDLNCHGMDSTGKEYNISYEHLRENIENNLVYVSNVLKSEDEILIFIAVPLKIKGTISGILWGKLPIINIMKDENNNNKIENSHKYFQIVDDRGHFLFSSNCKCNMHEPLTCKGLTIWEKLSTCQFSNKMSVQKIQEMVQKGESGNFYCENNGQGKYVHFRPLKINNWYLFSTQEQDELHDYVDNTRKIAINFFIILTITLLIIFGIIYNIVYSMYKNVTKQHHEMQTINGMFQAILQQTQNVPFTIDHKIKHVILYGYPKKENVNYYSFSNIHPENMLKNGILDTENFKEYKKLYQNVMIYGKPYKPTILLARINGKKEWIRISFISNFQNNMGQIIGVMEGYTEQKEKDIQIENHLDNIKRIEEKSQIDFLTKLYNRETFIEKVKLALENNKNNMQISAFLILDLDHFKEVNDCMGHTMGDMALQETASIIHNFFRNEDIVGRLGGDEFIVFAQNIRNIYAFEKRIKRLNHLLCKTYKKDDKSVQISSSIGIVLTDTNNLDFNTLYEKADKALYKVKESGRNGYQFYSKNK